MAKLPTRPPRVPTAEEREWAQVQAQALAEGRAERARQAREHAIQREQDASDHVRRELWAEEWQRQAEQAQRERELLADRWQRKAEED